MKKYRNLIIIGVLLVALLGFAGYYYQSGMPVISTDYTSVPAATAPTNNSFTLVLDLSSGTKSFAKNFTEDENLYDALRAATLEEGIAMTSKEYPGIGYLVESIGTDKNGTGGKYWQFWVNDEYAAVGASDYKINPGDIIEWKFTNE